jgi:hypothetical protein
MDRLGPRSLLSTKWKRMILNSSTPQALVCRKSRPRTCSTCVSRNTPSWGLLSRPQLTRGSTRRRKQDRMVRVLRFSSWLVGGALTACHPVPPCGGNVANRAGQLEKEGENHIGGRKTDRPDLQLTIEESGDSGRDVRVTFRNVSPRPLWVECMSYAHAPEEQWASLSFRVVDANGKPFEPPSCRPKNSMLTPDPARYVWLPGGGTFSYAINLECYAPVYDAPLLVTARFHDQSDAEIPIPPGLFRFVGDVTSNTLLMHWRGWVRSPDGDAPDTAR